jgi:hypothetical protein
MKPRVSFGSKPYAFRLSGRPADKVYANQIDRWIKETIQKDPQLGVSQALAIVVKGLIDRYVGESLVQDVENQLSEVQSIRDSIMEEVRQLVYDMFEDGERVGKLAEISKSAAGGERIEQDVIDNIFADFGRK